MESWGLSGKVTGLGGGEEGLDGEEGGANGESGGPLVLQDVQADCASLGAHVGVPNFGVELHLWRHIWVLFQDFNVDLEDTVFVDGVGRAVDLGLPVVEVAVH